MIRLHSPVVTREPGGSLYEVRIDSGGRFPGTLWYRVAHVEDIAVTHRSDPAAVALLMPCMAMGLDLQVDGVTTAKLVHLALGDAQEVLRRYPRRSLHRIEVHPTESQPQGPPGHGVVAGFSGGIDSFDLIVEHHFSPTVPRSRRLTHLLFNNVGSHGYRPEAARLFPRRLERARSCAARLGLPMITVDSNLDEFYRCAGINFVESHTLRNASVPFLLSDSLRTWIYASGLEWPSITLGSVGDMAQLDPLLLPLLTQESLMLLSCGMSRSRIVKTERVSRVSESYDSLDVCTRTAERRTARHAGSAC